MGRARLDPQAGTVTLDSPALQYYPPDWTFQKQVTGKYIRKQTCRATKDPGAALLQAGINHCLEWAAFLVEVAAVDGILSRQFDLSDGGHLYDLNQAMLVGKQAWNHGALQVNQLDAYVWKVSQVSYVGKQMDFTYDGDMAQGPNVDSPGWFGAGDHALVSFNGAVYDPSYGTGPYASASGCAAVGCWAQDNIAGLATMVAYAGTLGNVYQAQQCLASPPAGLGLRDAAVPFECVWRVTDANPAHNWNYAPPPP